MEISIQDQDEETNTQQSSGIDADAFGDEVGGMAEEDLLRERRQALAEKQAFLKKMDQKPIEQAQQ